MRSQPIRRRRLHLLDDILRRRKVHKRRRAELAQAHLALVVARVNRDDVEAHRLGVLLRDRAEPASGADDGDALARARAGFFESFVDGDAYRSTGSALGQKMDCDVQHGLPAQRMGATAARSTSLGMRATCAALATAYCWKEPSTV